jgi:hypothetical protein
MKKLNKFVVKKVKTTLSTDHDSPLKADRNEIPLLSPKNSKIMLDKSISSATSPKFGIDKFPKVNFLMQ